MLSFVIMRDRVTYAQQCVQALLDAGLDVVIVDHDSRWPEARTWLREEIGPGPEWPRVWHDFNNHPRDLWRVGGPLDGYLGRRPADERFVVTDCDTVPDESCPADWPGMLATLLDFNPRAVKAGLGLRTDDLPEHFEHRDRVQRWEARFQRPAAPWVIGDHTFQPPAVWADVDTTLAMYRGFETFRLGPAIRTAAPYWARHLPWYEDTANLPEELRFYADRAEHGHWRRPDGFTDTHALEGP